MTNPGDIEAVLQIKDQMSAGLTSIASALGRLENSFKSVQGSINATNKSVAQFADQAANLTTQLGGWGKVHFDRVAELKKISERLNNARTVMIGYGAASRQAAASQLPLAANMETVDQVSNKQIARFTKLTFKIVALQTSTFSLGSVAAHAGENIKRGFDAAHVALAAFVGVITFSQKPMALAIGGILALAAGLAAFIAASPAAAERFKTLTDAVSTLRQTMFESSQEISKNLDILLLGGAKQSEVGEAVLQKLISRFETIRQVMPDLTDKLIGFNGMIKKIQETGAGLGGQGSFQRGLLDQLGLAIGEKDFEKVRTISGFIRDLILKMDIAGKESSATGARALAASLRELLIVVGEFSQAAEVLKQSPIDIVAQRVSNLLKKSREEAAGFLDSLRDIQQIGEMSQGFGIENSLELARSRAAAAAKQVAGLLEMVQKLRIATRDETITKEQRAEIEILITELTKSRLGTAISENRAAEENLKLQERIFKVKEKMKEMDLKFGFAKAIEEFTDEFRTLKDLFKDVFGAMEESFSGAFRAMMGSGKKFRDSMRQVFKDVGNAFKKMISEFLANQLMRELLMAIMPSRVAAPGGGSLAQLGGGIGGGLLMSQQGTPIMDAANQQSLSPGAGLLSGGLFAGGNSLLGLSSGLIGGVGLAGVLGASQAQDPVSGGLMGAAGGAMAGFAIGGPIGAVLGGIGGGLIGLFSGDKAKEEEEKAKEAEEEAAQQAAEELERQRAIAQDFVLSQIQNRYRGGLATKEAAVALGALMSSGLSVAELESFGTPAELAAQAQMAGAVTNVGGIQNHFQITAHIGGQYDVARLSEDLGQAIIGSVDSAVAGGV